MLRNYLKVAWKVLLRRKFFTFVSLFGISFTLVVLMVATALLDYTFAAQRPETRQDRTLTIQRAHMFGEHNTWGAPPGYALLDRYGRNLPGVERFAITTTVSTAQSFVAGQKVTSMLRRTDAEYWKILDFEFLEGAPFDRQDVDEARFVAVIDATTREKLLGGRRAVGETIEADGQRFRVVGVVPDVPATRMNAAADIWVPITTAKTDGYKHQMMGDCNGIALLAPGASASAAREELRARLKHAELPDPRNYTTIIALLETRFEALSGEILGSPSDEESHPERLLGVMIGVAFLFMLLPTVNLVNLNMSRIMERASEIGVRKAFGASAWTLVGQFVVENVVLSVVGGAVGLLFSVAVLQVLNRSEVIPYANLQLNVRIFLYGLGLAVFFGLFSGVYPAWRMSRLNPVQALKGATR